MSTLIQQFLSFTRRFPLVVASLVVFVTLGVGNYFLWDRQKLLTKQHEEARSKGEAVLQSLTTHPRISAELATVKEALSQIENNLIVESDLSENYGYFYQIETLSHIRLTVNQLSSVAAAEGNPYRAVPFSLRVVGSFSQIIILIHELETGPRLLRIKSCTMTRTDPKTNALTMDLTVELLASR